MKTFKVIVPCIMAVIAMTACGKNENSEPVQSEPAIVARQENLTTTQASTDAEETTEADTEEKDISLKYDAGIQLAAINMGDRSIPVISGTALDVVMEDTGLHYIDWSMVYTDASAINFYGKGYALHDVSREDDVPESYVGTEVTFEVSDADGNRIQSLEGDKSQYMVAGIKASYNDEDKYDYTVTFEKGVQVGMEREKVEELLGKTDGSDDSLYVIEDLALYIDYNFDGIAESIYAVPSSLVNIPED
mgnify:CR=1 FL=1